MFGGDAPLHKLWPNEEVKSTKLPVCKDPVTNCAAFGEPCVAASTNSSTLTPGLMSDGENKSS